MDGRSGEKFLMAALGRLLLFACTEAMHPTTWQFFKMTHFQRSTATYRAFLHVQKAPFYGSGVAIIWPWQRSAHQCQQFDIPLITVTPVFFLAGLFADNAQRFQQLDGGVGGGEGGVELLARVLDGEARHQGQTLKQAVAGGSRFGGGQQSAAVVTD